jgi:hypothetical protein
MTTTTTKTISLPHKKWAAADSKAKRLSTATGRKITRSALFEMALDAFLKATQTEGKL